MSVVNFFTFQISPAKLNQMESSFAGMGPLKRRFRFVQIKLILDEEGLLGVLKGRLSKLKKKKILFKNQQKNATRLAVDHY